MSAGVHTVRGRDQWQQSAAGGGNTHLCNTSTCLMFHWREPQSDEVAVCRRRCQVTQETRPVSRRQCLCTFVLVWKDKWCWWTRGQLWSTPIRHIQGSDRSINKLQNDTILLISECKNSEIYIFLWNLIGDIHWKIYGDAVVTVYLEHIAVFCLAVFLYNSPSVKQ